MAETKPVSELPKKLEKAFAALSVYFQKQGNELLQKIVVNSSFSVAEQTDYDNWNGGQYGHTVTLHLPATLYFEVLDDAQELGNEIRVGIHKVAQTSGEYIHVVLFELQDDTLPENWRERSGALLEPTPLSVATNADQLGRLWEPHQVRVFLSHKATFKGEAGRLKSCLASLGISAFLAHVDIEPTREWQDEIERALFSTDALVALMTEDFSDSAWTDQEIGIAIGRRVPIVSVRLGKDPYGFVGKYQGVVGRGKTPTQLAAELFDLFLQHSVLHDRLAEWLVRQLENAGSFASANQTMHSLLKLRNATPQLIKRIENAQQANVNVERAFDVQSMLPGLLRKLKGQA